MASREEILAYVKRKFQTEPDYPWRQYPEYAVLRHAESGKWYGVLGLAGKGDVEVVNLKCDHVLDVLLNSEPGAVLPAYHMNKKHWLTIVLDGKFTAGELYGLIDESHGLTR